MNIAIVTKQNMKNSVARNGIVARIKAEPDFCVTECASVDDVCGDFDRIVVFGGDGTVLETVQKSARSAIPVLGINLGNLGFLTDFEQGAETADIINALKGGDIVSRMLLNVNVENGHFHALNEVVIKSVSAHPIYLDLYIDNEYVDSYHSDGLIISSPTGSTAYSLSAGGPVLSPNVDAVVIIPVCAHSLHSRPLVINSESRVDVTLRGQDHASVTVDGQTVKDVTAGDSVTVTKSKTKARFVKCKENKFYRKLHEKMNAWGTTVR